MPIFKGFCFFGRRMRRPRTLSADKPDRCTDALVLGRMVGSLVGKRGFSRATPPRHQLIGDFDHRVPARRTDIFARFYALIGKSFPLGHADAFDGRLVPVRRQVAGDGDCTDLFLEKSQTQCVHDAPLIQSGNGVQSILAKDVEIGHSFRIEGVVGKLP